MWLIMRGWGKRRVKSAAYITPQKESTSPATRAHPTQAEVTAIVVMMELRDLRERTVVGLDIIMIMGKAKGRGRPERGVQMLMRRCLSRRMDQRRRADLCAQRGYACDDVYDCIIGKRNLEIEMGAGALGGVESLCHTRRTANMDSFLSRKETTHDLCTDFPVPRA